MRKYADDRNINVHKVDVILFAADDECMVELNNYARNRFNGLTDKYRIIVARSNSDKIKNEYDNILSNSAEESEHSFRLPETIRGIDKEGEEYEKHLYVNEKTGKYRCKLNSWESGVLEEEMKRGD